MNYLNKISQELTTVFDTITLFIKCDIEIFTVEEGCGLEGNCFDFSSSITSSLKVSKLDTDILDWIVEWHKSTSLGSNRWNKAGFTVYKDGRYEVKTWWDSEFQISLYGEDN